MKIISSKKLLETPIFGVRQDIALDPDGFEIKRAIVHHSGSAVVMPLDLRGRILLIKQFRLPAQRFMWELPAGRLDPGETVLQAAKRELQEETGYKARRWKKLISFFASPGFLEEKMTIYTAEDLTEGEQQPMEDERIQMKWVSGPDLDELIRGNQIQDAKTIIGFLAWKRYHSTRAAGKSAR